MLFGDGSVGLAALLGSCFFGGFLVAASFVSLGFCCRLSALVALFVVGAASAACLLCGCSLCCGLRGLRSRLVGLDGLGLFSLGFVVRGFLNGVLCEGKADTH